MSSRIAQTIAVQARVLRQRKEMSQAEVARNLGTSQNAIYRLENPKYGRPNISTLKKAASFYDVGLIVRFASFSEIVDWTTGLSETSMDVPDFDHDTGFIERKPIASVLPRMAQQSLEETQLRPDSVMRIDDRLTQSLVQQPSQASLANAGALR